MALDNSSDPAVQDAATTLDNGTGRRGRSATGLPGDLEPVHAAYVAALAHAVVLQPSTRRAYASRVRQYFAWLAGGHTDGDPLAEEAARDGAVRDWRTHLQTVAKQAPATVNLSLAAVSDFYARTGRGTMRAERLHLEPRAPQALTPKNALRWLRAVERRSATRDRLIGLIPFYAGLRIGEMAALDTGDVQLSARKGVIEVRSGKGRTARTVPVHRALREDLQIWLHDGERATWPTTGTARTALLPSRRGTRLTTQALHDVVTALADDAHLEDVTAHTLRHTFATNLVRWGVDVVTVAELMGHARLDTTRNYTRPCYDDLNRAVQTLPYDK
jgi:site-specific recombinase XerD